MSEFEFLRYVAVGQYLPTGSPIHRLDPRARLVAGLLLLAAITAAPRLTGLSVALIAVMGALTLARVPWSFALRGLLAPAPFIVLLAALHLLFGGRGGAVWLALGPVAITAGDVFHSGALILRFAALLLALTLVSCCISTTELVRGLEALLRPLTRLGLPTHDFVLMVQVALRFVPLLAREAERIVKAQAARGADWGTGRGGLLRRARQAVPVIVPLFVTALERAEALAVAMAARGYTGGRERTSMAVLRLRPADGVTLVAVTCLGAAIVFL